MIDEVGKMLNEIVKIKKINKLNIYVENGEKIVDLTISIPRNYKNKNGLYDCDLFPIRLVKSIAINTAEFCKINDLIGIRGRLENQDGRITIIPLAVSFLSKNKEQGN